PTHRHARLRAAGDLDLAPGEADAGAERLADRLLAGEARRVMLRGVRLRVAVGALGLGEAALAEARVSLERPRDPRDLDQIDSVSAAYSSPATKAPASRSAPREVCHQRFLCRQ